MNRSEVSKLLAVAQAMDPRLGLSDARVEAWSILLDGDMPLDFARDRLVAHYRLSVEVIMPADLVSAWKVERKFRAEAEETAKRLKALGEAPRSLSDENRAALRAIADRFRMP
jgi:hypothetical protein